jgi:hypothetical protein
VFWDKLVVTKLDFGMARRRPGAKQAAGKTRFWRSAIPSGAKAAPFQNEELFAAREGRIFTPTWQNLAASGGWTSASIVWICVSLGKYEESVNVSRMGCVYSHFICRESSRRLE